MKIAIFLLMLSIVYGEEETELNAPEIAVGHRLQNQFQSTYDSHFMKSEDEIGYRYMQLYQNVYIFLEDGLKNNLLVSEAEVSNRLASYKKVFSERFLNKDHIKNIIIIEKYLNQVKGLFTNEKAVADLYGKLTDSIVAQTKPSFAEMELLLNSMTLFADPLIGEFIQEKNDETTKEEYENVISKKLFWTVKELRLSGKPDDCVAFDPGSNRCIVTVAQFNSSISLMNISKKMPRDSARDEILSDLLSDIYLSTRAMQSGYAEKMATKELLSQNRAAFKNAQRFISLGRMVTDESKLFETYKKYYRERFSPRDEVYINISGSSDKAYIDSVYRLLCRTSVKNSRTRRNKASNAEIQRLPWQRSNWNELPDELVRPTDSIDINEFTGPIKTPYGYFIAHLDEVKRSKGLSFDEAYDELVYLATRDKWQNVDSILEEKAFEMYLKDKSRFVTPDTMAITLWLCPYYSDSTRTPVIPDTLASNGLRLCSVQLPFDVQEKLKEAYYQKKNANCLIGLIYTRYGAFSFQVHTNKNGGIQYSFDEVRDYLTAEIKAEEVKNSGCYAKQQDDIIDRMFLGKSYFIDDVTQARTMPYDQIMALIDNGTLDVSAVKNKSSKNDCYLYGKAEYERMKINEYQENIENWIKTVRIDRSYFN